MTMFTGNSLSGSGEAGKNKKLEEWTNNCNLLLKSMLNSLSVLYDGLETDEDSNVTDKEQNLELQDDETTVHTIAQTFILYCYKFVWLISEPTNGPVRLPLGSVINVISRCLRVSYTDVRSVPSMSELTGELPALHRAVLEILSQLVLSCKTSLLPQSRIIIDLCLQALKSTKYMDLREKSQTKAFAYQALCLIVQAFGWGCYLTHHSKSIVQELVADIKWQDSAKQQISATMKEHAQQETVQGGRKKGKKRKNKAESYSGLVQPKLVAGETGTEDNTQSAFEATVAALELSQLMLGRAEFLSVENLMRCILDTTQRIQREEPLAQSPFIKTLSRRVLYSAVFASSTVKLNSDCCRKDSITHFQLSNLAMSLLKEGAHKDHSPEVQAVCKDALNTLLVTGNLNRPIVRRIQTDENNVTKDVSELDREIDNAREENDNLQKRLIDSDLESQSQKRLIASLKQEIATIKERAATETIAPCAGQMVYLSDPTDYRDTADIGSEGFDESEFRKEESDEDEKEESDEEESKEAERTGKLKSNVEDENVDDQTGRISDERNLASKTQADEVKETISKSSAEEHSKQTKRKRPDGQVTETPSKKTKSERDGTNSSNTGGDCIEDMISDFVDADPDVA